MTKKGEICLKYKYLLFGFDPHEAVGGMDDLIKVFSTYDEFIKNYNHVDYYCYQLLETKDFTYKEFSTKIVRYLGSNNSATFKKEREDEFLEWIKKELV